LWGRPAREANASDVKVTAPDLEVTALGLSWACSDVTRQSACCRPTMSDYARLSMDSWLGVLIRAELVCGCAMLWVKGVMGVVIPLESGEKRVFRACTCGEARQPRLDRDFRLGFVVYCPGCGLTTLPEIREGDAVSAWEAGLVRSRVGVKLPGGGEKGFGSADEMLDWMKSDG
jgi:hypothetical protein